MNAPANAVRAEWGKLISVPAPLGCLVAAMALALVTAGSLATDFVVDVGRGAVPPGATLPVLDALTPAARTGLALAVAFAMLPITAEFGTGSIRSTLWAQPVRARVLHAKAAVVTAVAVPIGLLCAVACWWAAVVLLGDHAVGSDRAIAAWLPAVARVAMLFGVSAVLVVGLAATIRSAIGTLACALVLLIGLSVLPEQVAAWTPAGASDLFVSWDGAVYPPGVGGLVLLGWAGGAYGLGWWRFERRDV